MTISKLYPQIGKPTLPEYMRAPVQFPAQPYIYCGTRRLAGYFGPCIDLQPAGGGTAGVIGFESVTHSLNLNQANSFLKGTFGLVSRWYDQSGGARHLVQATTASMPSFDPANSFRGLAPVICDGSQPTGDASIPQVFKGLDFPTVSLGSRACTIFIVVRNMSLGDGGEILELLNASSQHIFNPFFANIYQAGITPSIATYYEPTDISVDSLTYCRNDYTILGISYGATNVNFYIEGDIISGTALPTGQTATKGSLGYAWTKTLGSIIDIQCLAIWNTALSTADMTTVANTLSKAYGVNMNSFDACVITDGDSRIAGFGVDRNQGLIDYVRAQMPGRRIAWFNLAVSGQLQQTVASNFDNNVVPIINDFVAAGVRTVYVTEGGINDTSGVAGNTLYNNYVKPLILTAKADGAKVVWCTIFHENESAGAEKTAVDLYNTTGSADGSWDFKVDFDALFPYPGPTVPTYSKDGTHLNNVGNAIVAPVLAQAIMQAIDS